MRSAVKTPIAGAFARYQNPGWSGLATGGQRERNRFLVPGYRERFGAMKARRGNSMISWEMGIF